MDTSNNPAEKAVAAKFPGAFTITPFRNDCLIEVLWEPAPQYPRDPRGPMIPAEFTTPMVPGPAAFIAGFMDGRALAVGRIAMMPEPSEEGATRRRNAEAEEIAEAVGNALGGVLDVLRPLLGKPRVQVGSLVLYPAGGTTPIPVEGYENTRLLPLSAIVARLDS